MTNEDLSRSYLIKAEKRLKILDVLLEEEAYSDVVREAQEIVELSLKGMLRFVGIEPPKYHDVSPIIVLHREKFKYISFRDIKKMTSISKKLRREGTCLLRRHRLHPNGGIYSQRCEESYGRGNICRSPGPKIHNPDQR